MGIRGIQRTSSSGWLSLVFVMIRERGGIDFLIFLGVGIKGIEFELFPHGEEREVSPQ